MLKLLFFASATYAADVARVGACVCGSSCQMSATALGTCQPNGECAVNFLPPNCNGPVASLSLASNLAIPTGCPMIKCVAPNCPLPLQETPKDAKGCNQCPRCRTPVVSANPAVSSSLNTPSLGDFTSGPSCPVFRCIVPNCAANQLETPKDANGCPLCPKCVGVQLGPNVFSAASSGTAVINPALNLDLDIKTSGQPCPVLSCPPLNCPPALQEQVTGANGCLGCPRCRQLTGNNAITNTPAAAGKSLGASLDLTAAVCPLLSCLEPNCPAILQEKTTGANGCPGCPRCRQIGTVTGKAGKLGKAKGLSQTLTNPVDACALIRCLPNYKCVNGACESNLDPCATVRCSSGFVCMNGQCVSNTFTQPSDPCATVRCSSGFVCMNGQCVSNTFTQPSDPCATVRCAAGFMCMKGQCVSNTFTQPPDPCATVRCAAGFVCMNGQCVSNTFTQSSGR